MWTYMYVVRQRGSFPFCCGEIIAYMEGVSCEVYGLLSRFGAMHERFSSCSESQMSKLMARAIRGVVMLQMSTLPLQDLCRLSVKN